MGATLIGLPAEEHPGGPSTIAAKLGVLKHLPCAQRLRVSICKVRSLTKKKTDGGGATDTEAATSNAVELVTVS